MAFEASYEAQEAGMEQRRHAGAGTADTGTECFHGIAEQDDASPAWPRPPPPFFRPSPRPW
jgi:hypothetical protein